MRLHEMAYARSGDKGSNCNIGVIAHTVADYEFLLTALTAEKVQHYFAPLGPKFAVRYELPNLLALNFVLHGILDGGLSLRADSQGKALGQALLQIELEST